MATAAAVPYILQDNFVSVFIGGRPFQLLSSHPTFRKMVSAIKAKKWAKVPDLVNLAMSISNRSHGNVEVKDGKVFYKGTPIHNSMSAMMLRLIEHNKPVTYMLKFMDNLYRNPTTKTINGLYEFLQTWSMPITDDGCFVTYKRVDKDYKDIHTHTVDNHVGMRPLMERKAVDPNPYTACSQGYHCCSRTYLSSFPGEHLMAIKVNPKDVVEVPEVNVGKLRTWTYEVIAEIPNGDYREHDAEYFQNPLIMVGRDRRMLVNKLLALPVVKRLIARTERTKAEYRRARRLLGDNHPKVEVAGLTKSALQKASFNRLQQWYQRLAASAPLPVEVSSLFENPCRPARIAAKLTVGQVAKQMDLEPSVVYRKERDEEATQAFIDNYVGAVMALKGSAYGIAYAATAA